MADKIFPIGLYVNPPNDKAPDFVKWSISIQKDKFAELFEQIEEFANDKWYCKFNILEWKEWKWYATVDTYKPTDKPANNIQEVQKQTRKFPVEEISLEDIPF